MNWRLKCAAFRLLSAIPGGEGIYRFAQRHITRSIVPTADRVRGKVGVALDYIRWLHAHGHAGILDGGTHIDFGSGWTPKLPFTFYACGMGTQRLLDLTPVMDAGHVSTTIRMFREVAPGLAKAAGIEFKRLPAETSPSATLDEQLHPLGIRYEAPYGDLLAEPAAQADLVTSTQVLLHIEETDLRHCLRAIYHILKPGGLFMATIHLRPLYGSLEASQVSHDYLTFSPEEWARFGSRIMSYTRLKAPDYRRLLEEAGFTLPGFDITPGTPEDFTALETTRIHSSFAHYTREDLAARLLVFAAQKPAAAT